MEGQDSRIMTEVNVPNCMQRMVAAVLSWEELVFSLAKARESYVKARRSHQDQADVDAYVTRSQLTVHKSSRKVRNDFESLRAVMCWHGRLPARHEQYFLEVMPYGEFVSPEAWKKTLSTGTLNPTPPRHGTRTQREKTEESDDLPVESCAALDRARRELYAPVDSAETTIGPRRIEPPDQARELIRLSGEQEWRYRAARAQAIACELLAVKRLLETAPDQWREHEIFEGEILYAKSLWHLPAFRSELSSLLRQHLPVVRERCAAGELYSVGRHESYRVFLEAGGIDGLSDAARFDHDFDHLCERYCIEGVKRKSPWVLPEQFRFELSDTHMYVAVPNHMNLAWSRNLPTDVVKMIQARGTSISRVIPRHRNAVSVSPNDTVRLVHRYRELRIDSDRGRSLSQEEIYAQLNDEICHYESDGTAERRCAIFRQIRRILEKADVPPF